MISSFLKWDNQQANWQNGPVVYLAAQDVNLLREAERFVLQRWREQGNEPDAQIEGPVPDFGELIAQTGAISLFGGTRHVILRELFPSSLSDKDVKELQALFADLENAVLMVTALYKDNRAITSKKANNLKKAAQENGFFANLTSPSDGEIIKFMKEKAAACGGVVFAPGAAEELLERSKGNLPLLKNETEKLAALSQYTVIDKEMVRCYSVRNIEADVFELLRKIVAGQGAGAQAKLAELFALKTEAVAIAAGLGSSFVDMLRVRTAAIGGHSIAQVLSQMHYTGGDYRLKKAKENAAAYSLQALKQAVLLLAKLDKSLKSSALADKNILVQAAVAELVLLTKHA